MSKTMKTFIQIIFILLIAFILTVQEESYKFEVKLDVCIDGDTAKFITGNGIETVRFLAVDTPETVHPGIQVEPFA
ncbi:MAG: thermonuclease, partial [Bacilli bacterium]|nr:thermonuclease [Bacilli bacterium]MDD4053483.1 thermonuclease [Bacilli bacterium]MDD4411518.1 thermonuclease [Bacilli bacterium]